MSNTFDVVTCSELDDLIAMKKVVAFRRSTGWVDVSKDPLRGQGVPGRYQGPERRRGGSG
jgi:hypothetical protein